MRVEEWEKFSGLEKGEGENLKVRLSLVGMGLG